MIRRSFSERRTRFAATRLEHPPSTEETRQVRIRIEIGLIAVLAGLILLFSVFKRRPVQPVPDVVFSDSVSILVDEAPITRQGRPKSAPSRPMVPIPDETELLPEDLTLDPELFAREPGVPLSGTGDAGDSEGGPEGFLPRPIREAVPEFPESDRSKGIQGTVELRILVNAGGRVDSVQVLRNTTGSDALARAAKAAAYRSLYRPPSGNLKGRSCWITRPYRFKSR